MTHTLSTRDLDLARRLASHYGPDGDGELESAAMMGLLSASHTYNGASAWRAYASRSIRWALLDHIGRTRETPVDIEALPDTTETLHPDTTPTEDEEIIELIHDVLAGFDALDMLQRIDRRRKAHRQALDYFELVLT